MRSACLLLLLCIMPSVLPAQSVDWRHFDTSMRSFVEERPGAKLQAGSQKKIVRFLKQRTAHTEALCVEDPEFDAKAHFSPAPLGRPGILFVEAAFPCRGNANGPGWLVDISTGRPRLIASLFGWGFGVQRPVHHGLRDLVMATHFSAFETGLDWYRYDGAAYRSISTATLYANNEVGLQRMAEAREHCRALKQSCNLILSKQSD